MSQDRQPPSDTESEKRYVGAVLLSRSVLEKHPVSPDDFHTRALGTLLEHLQTYPLDGPITAEGLVAWLPAGDLEACGGRVLLAECVQSAGHVGHAGLFAERIRTAAQKRRIILLGSELFQAGHNGQGDAADLVAEYIARLESIADASSNDRFKLLSMGDLDAADFSTDYVVEGVLAVGEPVVIGGMFKAMKTSIALDLFLSVGTGVDFLGRFPVSRTARAIYFLGEGRGPFAQDVCRRVAASKGLALSKIDGLHLCTELPCLDNAADLAEAARIAKRQRAEFCFFDPLYLGLGDSGERASNVFVIGQRLAAVQRACVSVGATPIIVHHLRKGRVETDSATLTDLAQAGAAEFAGQWALLNRTRPYDEATPGTHDLRLAIGSRLGHSSAWGLRIDEGTSGGLSGRVWQPEVTPWTDAVKAERDARDEAKEAAQREIIEQHKDRILEAVAMFGATGETQSTIRAAVGLSGSRFAVAFGELIRERSIESCEVQKANRKAPYQGYRLAE